jgi:DNA-binding beta-propeller fold protein YncE
MDPGSVTVHPSGRFACVANQGDSTVSIYTINQTTDVLTPTAPPDNAAGGGPFGVTIAPSGNFAYVPTAYGNNNVSEYNVSEYSIDSSTGVLTATAVGAAPAGSSPTSSGNLSHIGTIATGAQPRRVSADPSGEFVYVANESGSISIFALNSDGRLSSAGTVETPSGAFAITVVQARQ